MPGFSLARGVVGDGTLCRVPLTVLIVDDHQGFRREEPGDVHPHRADGRGVRGCCCSPARTSARSPWRLLFGRFSLIYGISEIVLGAELRQTEHNAHRIMERAA